MLSYGETLDPALKTAFAREWGGIAPEPARFASSRGSLAAGAGRRGTLRASAAGRGDAHLRHRLRAALEPGGLSRSADRACAGACRSSMSKGGSRRSSPGEGDIDPRPSRIAGQGQIEADLFVDCSGPAATLLASQPGFAMFRLVGQPADPHRLSRRTGRAGDCAGRPRICWAGQAGSRRWRARRPVYRAGRWRGRFARKPRLRRWAFRRRRPSR